MTTRNFRVRNGLSVGDIVINAATNQITGISTSAPSADGDVVVKGYLDTRLSALSSNSLTQLNSSATITDSGSNGTFTVVVDGTTVLTQTTAQTTVTNDLRVSGDLTVDGTQTILNTTTLSVEDNIIEVNRNVSSNAATPTISGLQVNRGEGSTATEKALLWAWDESFADDGSTIYGNAGGAWTAFKRNRTDTGAPTSSDLVDIRANVVHATSTSAQYADLAERFAADAPMAEGAVVMLGGSQEITETYSELSDEVFGVVSTRPAYAMNAGAGNNESHPFVAMSGRIPVRVVGPVTKGQRLVTSAVKGTARAVSNTDTINPFHVIGRALEDKHDDAIGMVNCVVRTNN